MSSDDEKQKAEDVDEIPVEEEIDETSELLEKVKDLENKYKRALADYQNLEKRVRAEKSDWIRLANKELILRFLPVVDTLLMASKHSQDQTLQVTLSQFLDTLKSEGVEKIKTDGKMFDPATMECLVTEVGEEGKVLEELRPGYIMNSAVIRPAGVKVGKASN